MVISFGKKPMAMRILLTLGYLLKKLLMVDTLLSVHGILVLLAMHG